MKQFTLSEFRKIYPDEETCLHKVFLLRYGHLKACPKCACVASWRRIKTRRCYQCRNCYEQFYPTAQTVFEKTRTPLVDWFYTIYLFTVTRSGVAAKEIERQLGCSYKCAWRMGHQIRKLMSKIGEEKLRGFVEVDELYMKSTRPNSVKNKEGENESNTPIVGMVERLGNIRVFKMENVKKENVFPLIEKHVDKSAIVNTDEFHVYKNLYKFGYQHQSIMHALKLYRIGSVSTNTIEGAFSGWRRMIPTHIHISYKYLDNYLGEYACRYNNRKKQSEMFEIILKNLPLV